MGSASASLRREFDNFADDVSVETSPKDRATPPDYRSPISVVSEQNRGRYLIGAPTISIKRDNSSQANNRDYRCMSHHQIVLGSLSDSVKSNSERALGPLRVCKTSTSLLSSSASPRSSDQPYEVHRGHRLVNPRRPPRCLQDMLHKTTCENRLLTFLPQPTAAFGGFFRENPARERNAGSPMKG